MKKIIASLAIAAFAIAPALAGPTVGEQAPGFSATTTTGEVISNETLAGKMVVLEWTNHGCPYVVAQYDSGNMQATQSAAAEKDVVWVSIVSSAEGKQGYVTAEEANALSESRGAKPTHVVLDPSGELGRLYEAKTTPHMFVIGEDWTLGYAGAIDTARSTNRQKIAEADNFVLAAMNSMATGESVEVGQSKPYGCGVKYGKKAS